MKGQQLGYIYIYGKSYKTDPNHKNTNHFPTADNWCDHKPETVIEIEGATILWDMPVSTDKQINANRPDIIVIITSSLSLRHSSNNDVTFIKQVLIFANYMT